MWLECPVEETDQRGRTTRATEARWVVGGKAPMDRAASASQMGRFETEWLAGPENLAALADPPTQWTVVADQLAREADQDRRQGGEPRPPHNPSDGRGRRAATDAPGNRPTSGAAGTNMTG